MNLDLLLLGAITEFADSRSCNAVRVEPIIVGCGGNAYWKLNCCGKSDVLHQGRYCIFCFLTVPTVSS